MKLTKRCSDHLLAHLYEHIFFMHLDTELRDDGFFDIVDYSIDAFTEDGEVVFDIEQYADINLESAIESASSAFLSIPEFLDIAIAQVECEYGKTLGFDTIAEVESALLELNQAAWNTEVVHEVTENIITVGGELSTHKLQITVDYAGVEGSLKPLYRQVAGLTLNVMISDIADTYGGFVASEAYATDGARNLLGEVILKDQLEQSVLDDVFKDTMAELSEKGGYVRLLEALRDVSKLDNAPSAERTLEDTGVMMDDDKWRELATDNNLETILPLVHFTASYEE